MGRILTASIFAAIVLFTWSAVSWMVLTWHNTTLHAFKDEASVAKVMQDNTNQSGIYMLPYMATDSTPSQKNSSNELLKAGPVVFTAVYLGGVTNMQPYMIKGFIIQLLAAFFVGWLLSKTARLSYFGRVGFVLVFAIAASLACHLPYWNWWHFETMYTLITIGDMLVGWFLAGLVMAALIPGKRTS